MVDLLLLELSSLFEYQPFQNRMWRPLVCHMFQVDDCLVMNHGLLETELGGDLISGWGQPKGNEACVSVI